MEYISLPTKNLFLLLGQKQSQSPTWAPVPYFFSGQITKSILFQKADLVMDIWSLSLWPKYFSFSYRVMTDSFMNKIFFKDLYLW